ncbi:MAG: uracil-DNA glycosylase [Candidatus Bathyarchaeia archaeon]
MATNDLLKLHRDIIICHCCPRLRYYRQAVARKKKREFQDQPYWGRPVPPLGDKDSQLLIIGLAPAAHGANRTGRMFTGDSSGTFLMSALFKYGFSNQPTSTSADDGLRLFNTFLTAIVKCAPPKNKPTKNEIKNCRSFLYREFSILKDVKVVLTLGRLAFDQYRIYLKSKGLDVKNLVFRHGSRYSLGRGAPVIYCSYHPSRQNTQTGKLTPIMFGKVLSSIKGDLMMVKNLC